MEKFDLMAKNYDTDVRKDRAEIIADEIRSYITDGANKSAIEFGCGTGLVGFNLIDCFHSLTFIDSSTGMIEEVKRKLADKNKLAFSAICCDLMEEVPQDLHSADYIFSSLVLHHIDDTEAILSRLYNLLNKDGHLLLIDLDIDDGGFHTKHPDFDGHNGFEQSMLSELSKKVGFVKTEIRTFYHACKIVNGGKKPYSLFIMDAVK